MSFNEKKVDEAGLRALYESENLARALFAWFASRKNNSQRTSVDSMHAIAKRGGVDAKRSEIVGFVKKLESLGCGTVITGRRGAKTRIAWDGLDLRELGLVASNRGRVSEVRVPATEQPNVPDQSDVSSIDEIRPGARRMIVHSYKLRLDLEVEVALPHDLTRREAERIANFVRTLPYSEE